MNSGSSIFEPAGPVVVSKHSRLLDRGLGVEVGFWLVGNHHSFGVWFPFALAGVDMEKQLLRV